MALLIFSKTTGYRHESIAVGVKALLELAEQQGLRAEASEDAQCFAPEYLSQFRAVVWLSASGNVLDAEQRAAFQAFVLGGGGYAGIHAASAAEPDWPWYAELVGARFTRHPEHQPGRLIVEDRQHPATAHLGEQWLRRDEWYAFDRNPRPRVTVLMAVDESSYRGGTMGDHPLVWCHELGLGRSFYSALGHTSEDFSEPGFLRHLAGGITWAARAPLR